MYIVTPSQMKAAEAAAVERGISYLQLMENAGASVAAEILRRIPDIEGRTVLVICGKGNNGGDGYVIARLLADRGADVIVSMSAEPSTGISAEEFGRIKDKEHIRYCDLDNTDTSILYDIIIDCLFGTGFHGVLSNNITEFMKKLDGPHILKVAVDIPSGADSISGRVSEGTFSADVTVTFGAVKSGMIISPAKECCGEIVLADIGITDECFSEIGCAVLMDDTSAAEAIPVRDKFCHKGTFGKMLVIAGSDEMSGAAAMNVTGALRSGAGIVRLASVPSVINRTASGIYESTYLTLSPTADGKISADNTDKLKTAAEKMSCVSIGSGLSVCEDTKTVVTEMMRFCGDRQIPMVIDADGLNCISDNADILKEYGCRAILTPHPAELGRLLGISTADVMEDRLSAAHKLAEKSGAIVVAKGMPTYIVSPDGRAKASYTGNGGLSRGGSGDILTGIISGTVCMNSSLFESACAAVYIFGLAADLAADVLSTTAMLPTDAAAYLTAAYRLLGR